MNTNQIFNCTMNYLTNKGKVRDSGMESAIPAQDTVELKGTDFEVLGTLTWRDGGVCVDLFIAGANKGVYPLGTLKSSDDSNDTFRKMAVLMADFQISAKAFVAYKAEREAAEKGEI